MTSPTGATGASSFLETLYSAYKDVNLPREPAPYDLRSALRSGHIQEALSLIQQIDKRFIGEPDESGQTALHWAALCDDRKVCELLLAKLSEDDVLRKTYMTGQNALHYAARNCNGVFIEVIKNTPYAQQLAEAKDTKCVTPLYYAAEKGDTAASKLLLEIASTKEAVCSQNKGLDEQSALHRAVILNQLLMVEVLLNPGPGKATGVPDVVKALVGMQDKHGQTALHWAVWKGYYAICEKLYEKMDAYQVGLPMDPGNRKQTALHFAVQGNRAEKDDFEKIVRLLLSNPEKVGSLVGVQDKWGQTALHWAAGKKPKASLEVCRLLCEAMKKHPTTLLAQTEGGCTALHFAEQAGRKDVEKAILDAQGG